MDEQAIRTLTENAQAYAVLVQWLMGLLAGSGAVITGLFYFIMRAKDDVNAAYREVAPIATASLDSARALEKLVQRADTSGAQLLPKIVERLERVVERLEEVERGLP